MAYSLIQAGSTLQLVSDEGEVTSLSPFSGLVLSTSVKPRWQVHQNKVVVVGSPSVPITVNSYGDVVPLTPTAPDTAPTVAAGSSGGLTGDYEGIRYTYIITDVDGNLVAESDYSPASGSVTLSSDNLQVTGLVPSSESFSSYRLYRPVADGTTLFKWIDVDAAQTSVEDDLADSALSLLASPTLGSPGHLSLIAEWRNRLFGVSSGDVDTLLYAQADAMWSWPSTNTIPIPGTGRDSHGITALMPRQEVLGVGRRDAIWQIVGTTPSDFRAFKLSEILGVESQETVVTYRDTVWWLWKDGVYQWDSSGINCISDGMVRSWFTTSDYFNPDLISQAFAVLDPKHLRYRLYLAAAGSVSIDRWVEYDIIGKRWWGPHKTGAFSPTSAFLMVSDAGSEYPQAAVGASGGYIWKDTSTPTDGASTAIDTRIITKFYDADLPDTEKFWDGPTFFGKVQPAGTATVTPTVGYLSDAAQSSMTYDMTQGREKLPRLGSGLFTSLDIRHNTAGEDLEIYGLQLPYAPFGRRD